MISCLSFSKSDDETELRNCRGREGICVWLVDYGTSNKNEIMVTLLQLQKMLNTGK